jgi:hypothetical protein
MKITYIHQYFTTPEQGGGTRSFEMGRRLVCGPSGEHGHEAARGRLQWLARACPAAFHARPVAILRNH